MTHKQTYDETLARKSCTKAVYKFRFILKRSLVKLTIWGQIDQALFNIVVVGISFSFEFLSPLHTAEICNT